MDQHPLVGHTGLDSGASHNLETGWCCLDGQSLTEEALQQPSPARGVAPTAATSTATAWLHYRLVVQRPRLIGTLLPAVLVHLTWWSYVLPRQDLDLFTEVHGAPASVGEGSSNGDGIAGYWMSVTMVFGSLVAGATSVGGAAVAFPVMTLLFDISPVVARDFALMIQTVGMLSAAFAIWYQRILVDWPCIFWCTLGGIISTPGGLTALHFTGGLPPAIAKTIFLSSWLAFAVALTLLNFQRQRPTHAITPYPKGPEDISWKSRVYFVAGLLGGLLTVVSGSGMDLAAFAAQVCTLSILRQLSTESMSPTAT
eukprot:COSAG02_NODE_1712_length_11221_cov_93.698346_3_plen_312_part_00